jgi:hypothetical protein
MSTKQHKPAKVTRKFLNDLARKIYDPKSRRFLRLCHGRLRNGPDPTDKARPMHCGLGELYFAMTGKEPDRLLISEDGVVEIAVQQSPLAGLRDQEYLAAVNGIKKLHLEADLERTLLDDLDDALEVADCCFGLAEIKFREIMNSIPSKNDDTIADAVCSVRHYRNRARRVANAFREAAKLLPA